MARPPLTPLFALLVIRACAAFALQSAAVAAPSMLTEMQLSHGQIGLLMGTFMLPGIFLTVPGGLLARRIGDRPVMRGGAVLMAAGAVLAAMAQSYPLLLAGRLLCGIGGVMLLMLVITMTAARYAGPWLATATSVVIVSFPLGTGLALVVLGPVEAALGWRWVLGLAGLPAILAFALTFAVGHAPPLPPAGAASPGRAGAGMIAASAASWGIYNGALVVVLTFLPGLLVAGGASAVAGAAAASLVTWSFAVTVPFCGLLADRVIGRSAAFLAGTGATFALLLMLPPLGAPWLLLVLIGATFALPPGPLTAQLGDATPPATRPLVFGWYAAGSYIGMTSAPWLAGVLRDATGDANAPMLFAAFLMLVLTPTYLSFRQFARRGSRAA